MQARPAQGQRPDENVLELILKGIGVRKLRELTAADVRKGLSTSAMGTHRGSDDGHLALKRALRHAEAHDLVARNVATLAAPARASKVGQRVYLRLPIGAERIPPSAPTGTGPDAIWPPMSGTRLTLVPLTDFMTLA